MDAALGSLRRGGCVAILDDAKREGEVDLFFPAATISAADMRFLRREAGGELYIAIGHEVAALFGIPYISSAFQKLVDLAGDDVDHVDVEALRRMSKHVGDMCQGSCSVGLSLDHRSTHTGAPDDERSFTCRRLAELWEELKPQSEDPKTQAQSIETQEPGQISRANGGLRALQNGGTKNKANADAARKLGEEFHTPGHIFLCIENAGGLRVRQGHTELSIALGRKAGIPPLMVGCVMLCNEGEKYGALPTDSAVKWAQSKAVPFVSGADIELHVLNAEGS